MDHQEEWKPLETDPDGNFLIFVLTFCVQLFLFVVVGFFFNNRSTNVIESCVKCMDVPIQSIIERQYMYIS